jgi:hypothetical protein
LLGLKMHAQGLAVHPLDAHGWLSRAIPYTDPALLRPVDLGYLGWPVGVNNRRIQYAAGYATVPASRHSIAAFAWDGTRRAARPDRHAASRIGHNA